MGAAFFWPVFPIFGWGIGLVAHGWEVFGRDRLTEERIRAEMDRLR
ncbi:2TM domain-containing protein [Pseudonocardia lacus]|nr:2TM domain-containing protein [Pseudonocardia lacus]